MYSITTARQELLLARLRKIGEDMSGWRTLYIDPETQVEWFGYFPYGEMQGGGPLYLREKIIPTDWRQWIDACLLSSEVDDAVGLATDLRDLRKDRFSILDFLENRWSDYAYGQRNAFIKQLSFPRYPQDLIGKHVDQIEKEWSEEKKLIARIETLRNEISTASPLAAIKKFFQK
jgi:hypothetical protein